MRGLGFRSIAWVLLLAFTLQSFITQTHIHQGFAGAGDTATVTAPGNGPSHTGDPSQHSTSDCPFCQAVTHAGAFSTPPALSLILPIIWGESVVVPFIVGALHSVSSHPWHSRAPPRH